MLRSAGHCVIIERKDEAFYNLWLWYASTWDLAKFAASLQEVQQALGITCTVRVISVPPSAEQLIELLKLLPRGTKMDYARQSCLSGLSSRLADNIVLYDGLRDFLRELPWESVKATWPISGSVPDIQVFDKNGCMLSSI